MKKGTVKVPDEKIRKKEELEKLFEKEENPFEEEEVKSPPIPTKKEQTKEKERTYFKSKEQKKEDEELVPFTFSASNEIKIETKKYCVRNKITLIEMTNFALEDFFELKNPSLTGILNKGRTITTKIKKSLYEQMQSMSVEEIISMGTIICNAYINFLKKENG